MQTTTSSNPLLKVQLALETDFLLARQRARQIAALLGFEMQDQTRIATAVSEIARNAWEYAQGGHVEYFLETTPRPGIRIAVSDRGRGIPHLEQIWSGTYQSPTGMGIGLTGARRLLDGLDVETSDQGTRVTLRKYLPASLPAPRLQAIAAALAPSAQSAQPATAQASVALHDQNQELLTLLGELRARETELNTLNVELEETNRGVLALYAELADKAHAVQQASEMKTRFLSGVTHELRTPLNSIVSLARLMLGHTDGPLNAEQEKQANFILRSAQTLSEMVNDLLDLARIEAGKAAITTSSFTVNDLFAALRGMFRPLATNPEVKLVFVTPPEPIELLADEGKLSQILRNFIANAIKFTERGTITITATPLGESGRNARQIRFSVADTGIGIAPEHHELVMQEWGQVGDPSPRSSQRPRGSGLGLPLSRSLAELLEGSIGFVSTPGEGSTFFVTLPALAEPLASTAATARAGSGRILIVDDDEIARYLLRRQLGSLTSAAIEEANNASDALHLIAQRPPSLLFLDLLMPGTNGDSVLRQLRAEPSTARLPVIVHTAKPLGEDEIEALRLLDVTVIAKRPASGHSLAAEDAQRAALERSLLEVGLSNLHQEEAS